LYNIFICNTLNIAGVLNIAMLTADIRIA
jgi:hypothetical protein